MNMQLSEVDMDVLIDALEFWKRGDDAIDSFGTNLLTSLFSGEMNEEQKLGLKMQQEERERERKVKAKVRADKAIMIQAKLIALKHEMREEAVKE